MTYTRESFPRLLLVVLAALALVLYTLSGFGTLTLTHPDGFLGLGLLLGLLALVV